MSDDWKGEHHILRKPTLAQRRADTYRQASEIASERMRQSGDGVSRSSRPWSRRLRSEYLERVVRDRS